jgi:hypothetical protein
MRGFILIVLTATIGISEELFVDGEESPAPVVPKTESIVDPIQPSVKTGSLHLDIKPRDALVYLNGKKVCTDCILDTCPVGQYEIFGKYGDHSQTATVFVLAGTMRTVSMELERKTWFNVTSSFSQIWTHRVRSYGPSLDLGIQHKKDYYGINYHWNVFQSYYDYEPYYNPRNESSAMLLGGAAFQFYRTVYSYGDYIDIDAGFGTGFYYSDVYMYVGPDTTDSPYYYENYRYFTDFFFGGPSVRVGLGFQPIYATASYTLLTGTRFGHALVLGVRVRL